MAAHPLINRRNFLFSGLGIPFLTQAHQSAPTRKPQGPLAPIRFRNVARSAGLDFVLENSPTPRKHMIETMTGGVAAFDYNNDGLMDIFFVNGAAIPSLQKESPKYLNRLFRNEGGMKFVDVTAEAGVGGEGYSMGAAVGDFDNDGHSDLFVAGVYHNILYRSLGNGKFEDITQQAGIKSDKWSVAAAWLDYDNDGWLDLFVVNYAKFSINDDRFCGDRERNIRAYCHPMYFEGLTNTLYRNRRDGTFEDVTEKSGIGGYIGRGMGISTADYDNDGFMDVYVTNDNQANFLFHNRGDGTFEDVSLEAGVALTSNGVALASMGTDFRDYDSNGLPDIFFTALAGETFPLFRNLGGGMFEDATYSSHLGPTASLRSGWGNGFFDLNNDGWKDLFTANSDASDTIDLTSKSTHYRQPNSVFANLGDGTFKDVSAEVGEDFQASGPHRGCAFADFDNDGKIDIVVSALGAPAELWQNVSPADNHWLMIKLIGSRSNRDGIGARIKIGDQYNHMTTSVGYASSSAQGVHFGMGNLEKADRIEIRWPSGIVQALKDVRTNQFLTVREPIKACV